jgi:hypothetical protein
MDTFIFKNIINWITGTDIKTDKILNIEIKHGSNGVKYPIIRICKGNADEFSGFKQKITDIEKATNIIIKALEICYMNDNANSEVYIKPIKTNTFICTYYTLFEIRKFTPITKGASKGGFWRKTVKHSKNLLVEETKNSSILITEYDKHKDFDKITSDKNYIKATEKNITQLLKKIS